MPAWKAKIEEKIQENKLSPEIEIFFGVLQRIVQTILLINLTL